MPSPYIVTGIIGGLAILGFAFWTLFAQNQQYGGSHHGGGSNRTKFNPEPGYDKPRDSFEEDDWGESSRRRRRTRRSDECVICQEPLRSGNLIRRLPCPCGNRFHDTCITRWFQVERTCPICRNKL